MPGPDKLPGLPDATSFYQGAQGKAYHEAKRELRPEAFDLISTFRASKFQQHIRPSDVVFEYGLGAGWNLAKLKCARRMGYDPADFLKERLQALELEFIPDPNLIGKESIDVIICHHVLEHLQAPFEVLFQLRQMLRPEGRLVLHVPWEREWRNRFHTSDEPNHHLFTWNPQTLGNLLTLRDFQLNSIRVRRYGYDRALANFASRWKLGMRGFRFFRTAALLLRPLFEVEAVCKGGRGRA